MSRPDAIFSDGVVVNQGMRYDVYKSKSAWPTHPGADSSKGRQGLVFAPLCCMVVLAYLCLYTPKACRSQRLMARLSCNGSSMEVNSAAPWPAYSGMVRHVEVENANIYRWDRRPNTHGKACAERHSACGDTKATTTSFHPATRHDTTVVVVVQRETSLSCLCRGLVPVLFRVRYLISPAARLLQEVEGVTVVDSR